MNEEYNRKDISLDTIKNHIIEELKEQYARGLLEEAEFETLVEKTENIRSKNELARLAEELPDLRGQDRYSFHKERHSHGGGAERAEDTIITVLGEGGRYGVWRPPNRLKVLTVLGCAQDEMKNERSVIETDTDEKLQEALYRTAMIDEDLSGYTIAYYQSDAAVAENVPVKESDDPFRIVDYGPQAELPSEIVHPSIYVVFSQPVVSLSRLGRPLAESEFMTIDPPAKGQFRWYGTRMLSFDADTELLPQREYTVTINRDITSLGGKTLEGENGFSFRTEYLSLRDFFVGVTDNVYDSDDVPVEEARRIHLLFSYPVDLSFIERYIRIYSKNRPYEFSLSRSQNGDGLVSDDLRERTVVINVKKQFPIDSDVQVVLEKGAASGPDSLGIPKPIVTTFHTIKPFEYEYWDSYSWSFPRTEEGTSNPVYITFNHPLAETPPADNFRITPPIPVTDENITVWRNTVKLNNLFQPEKEYTITLSEDITDEYGQRLKKQVVLDVSIPPAERYAYFPNTGTMILEAEYPKKIVWETQNVLSGDWKVAEVEDPYARFGPEELYPFDFSGVEKNTRHFEVLDLKPWLNDNGKGCVGIAWNFAERDDEGRLPRWAVHELRLQVTDLAVTTRYGYNKIIAWVTSLSTGKPVEGAEVEILRKMAPMISETTNEQGLAEFKLEPETYKSWFGNPENRWDDYFRLKVVKGQDTLIFKPNSSHNIWRFGIYNDVPPVQAEESRMAAFLFTDRGLYRPGETVRFRGIDRTITVGKLQPYHGRYAIDVIESGYAGKKLESMAGQTSVNGGLDGSFIVPKDAEPGYYTILYSRGERSHQISFQVAHFRRLGFAVAISKPDTLASSGDTLSFSAQADYLSGGAVTGAAYETVWFKKPTPYSPPGKEWENYRFCPQEYEGRRTLGSEKGVIGSTGRFSTSQETADEGIAGMAYAYEMEARVTDAGNQTVASRASLLVHPASYYIGARLRGKDGSHWSSFVEKGKPVTVHYSLVLPDGKPISKVGSSVVGERKLTAELYKVTWKTAQQRGVRYTVNTHWERIEELVSSVQIDVDSAEGTFQVTPVSAGSYFIRLAGEDDKKRKAVTEFSFYATGADFVRWGGGDEATITLRPDRTVYEPGETAVLLAQTPLPKGRYLLTVEREGIFEERLIDLEGSAQTIEIPVKEEYLPVFYVSLASYSTRTGEPTHTYFTPDLDKPKGYFGIVSLAVDNNPKRIELDLTMDKTSYTPGEEAEIIVTARKKGKPVENAEITLVAVDRGVLDLIDYHIQDPLDFFYDPNNFPLGVRGADSRSLLIDPVTYEVKDLKGGGADDGKLAESALEQGPGGMDIRKDFNPTALFVPAVTTDEQGRATATFSLPDTLTTYRVTAVAAQEDLFGSIEDELQVRNPINVHTAFPEKLRVRDTAVGNVILKNLSGEKREVTVSLETDTLEVTGRAVHTFLLPENATIDVPFKIAATEAGAARCTIITESDVLNEKLHITIPVEKPYIYESATTVGRSEPTSNSGGAAEEGLIIPSAVEDSLGGLFLALDGSRLAGISADLEYLTQYPFDCMEQRVSRLLSYVLFGDYMKQTEIIPRDVDLMNHINEELGLWASMQQRDGGFPVWPDVPQTSSYYISLRVAHLLAYARENGYRIPDELNVSSLLDYLKPKEEQIQRSTYLMLYSLYVRSLFGEDLSYAAERWLEQGDSLGITGYGFLGLIFDRLGARESAEACLSRIEQFVRPGTRTVDITETWEAGQPSRSLFYNSRIEQLSLLLLLYSKLDPESSMISRISNTLFQKQKAGARFNTADTAWVIKAFHELYRLEGKVPPDFSATVALNGEKIAETQFEGRADETKLLRYRFTESPLSRFPKDTILPLSFHKEGRGTLYYSATLRYALPSEMLYGRDEGISVLSTFETLEGEEITEDRLVVGRTYRARVTVTSHRDRTFLALRVPVPSGCDIINSTFVTSAQFKEYEGQQEGPGRTDGYFSSDDLLFYSFGKAHTPVQKIMTNEVRYFWNVVPKGKQEATFLFRAVNAGVYPTPPATAECMYEPEVFGRTEGKLFIVVRKKE